MKRIAVVLASLLTSVTLAAQNPSQPKMTIVILPTQTIPACPIAMQARQGLWDHTVRVREGEQETIIHPYGQRFFLNLKDPHSARIISATLRVHGTTGRSRMVQTAGLNNTSAAEATKILTVPFTADDGADSADVHVPGFTSVSSVELQNVTYANGSTWKMSASSLCRVAPDPMMLVAEH